MEKVNLRGLELYHRPGTGDIDVLREVIEGDNYDLKNIHLPPRPKIIDVGAHIGAFSRLALSRWPRATVWSYEANRRNWDLLERNLSSFPNAKVFKGAVVGSEPENKRMIMSIEHQNVTGGWGIPWYSERPLEHWNVSEPIENFYNLHDAVEALGEIDLLKIDCEGSEWNIFYHMSVEDLRKVRYIVGEFHPGAFIHCEVPYDEIRDKLLSVFDCPALAARPMVNHKELYNVFAKRR